MDIISSAPILLKALAKKAIVLNNSPVARVKLVKLELIKGIEPPFIPGLIPSPISIPNNSFVVKSNTEIVMIKATTWPNNDYAEAKNIVWNGGMESLDPSIRLIDCSKSKITRISAQIGSSVLTHDVWILWSSIKILTQNKMPSNAKPFDPLVAGGSQILGAIEYVPIFGGFADDEGTIVGTKAAGKMVAEATITPSGIYQMLKSGFEIKRELMCVEWLNGSPNGKHDPTKWQADTSQPGFLSLVPDSTDKIYDTDAPNISYGHPAFETYNNFRQWVEFEGIICSDFAFWYWNAQWKFNKSPDEQIILKELGVGNKPLPKRPRL